MSTKTSPRRKARHRQRDLENVAKNVALLTGFTLAELDELGGFSAEAPHKTGKTCRGTCQSQCDDCHDIDNCVEATRQYGDLILCAECRDRHPAQQPWRIDPESGEYVDTKTGKVL